MGNILVVEDEDSIRDLIGMNLTMVGHSWVGAADAEEAMTALKNNAFDICLLDIMLPGVDGFTLLGYFKEAQVPVIFLTAKTALADRVKGLNLGAEDYIVKPFETLELLARVDVVLRRSPKAREIFYCKGIEIRLQEHIVRKNSKVIELTAQEYALLEALVRNRNLALSREQLLSAAWGYDYIGETRTVDMHIQRLRKKLEWEEVIKTVYKLGYRLEVPKE